MKRPNKNIMCGFKCTDCFLWVACREHGASRASVLERRVLDHMKGPIRYSRDVNAGTALSRLYAIVPAAGRSRRMGCPKQLLTLHGRPMLHAVLDGLQQSRTDGIVVVTHSDVARPLKLARRSDVFLVINDDTTSEMIDSVRLGLAELRRRTTLHGDDGIMVMPGDQPGVDPKDIHACMREFNHDRRRIIIATHDQRRGHPLIFPASLAGFVDSSACNQGLRALPRAHEALVQLVPCRSAGVIEDIDTPADFQRLTGLRQHPEARRREHREQE